MSAYVYVPRWISDTSVSYFPCQQGDNSSLSESPEEEDAEADRTDGWGSEDRPHVTPTTPTSPSSDEWGQSPRKRTQTLPNLIRGATASRPPPRDEALFRWSRIQESCDERDEKTFSEDIFKTLDLQGVSPFSPTREMEKEETEGPAAMDSEGSPKPPDLATSNIAPAPKAQSARHPDLSPVREEPVGSATACQPQHTPDNQGESTGTSQHVISRFVAAKAPSDKCPKIYSYISMPFNITQDWSFPFVSIRGASQRSISFYVTLLALVNTRTTKPSGFSSVQRTAILYLLQIQNFQMSILT